MLFIIESLVIFEVFFFFSLFLTDLKEGVFGTKNIETTIFYKKDNNNINDSTFLEIQFCYL